jgi:hypothetical protein
MTMSAPGLAGAREARSAGIVALACLAEEQAWHERARAALLAYVERPFGSATDADGHDAQRAWSGCQRVTLSLQSVWAYYVAHGIDPVDDLRATTGGLGALFTEAADSLAGRVAAALEAQAKAQCGCYAADLRSALVLDVPLRVGSGFIESIERAPEGGGGDAEYERPRGPRECSELRVAGPGDNHDGGVRATGPAHHYAAAVAYAGCHLPAGHTEPCDFSPLPDVEHVGELDVYEIERRHAQGAAPLPKFAPPDAGD